MPEAAAAKAERDFAQALPEGLSTAGQTDSAIEELATGERVGRLWFAARELDGRTVAYLYDTMGFVETAVHMQKQLDTDP
jgi:hypothetical protein